MASELSGLTSIISKEEPLINFPRCLKNRYKDDNLLKQVIANPEQFHNFSIEKKLLILIENACKCLCIPNSEIKRQNIHEVIIMQPHRLLAHMGYVRNHATVPPKAIILNSTHNKLLAPPSHLNTNLTHHVFLQPCRHSINVWACDYNSN
jgi:hypothetical protein